MRPLTYNEGAVLQVVRSQCRGGDPVATGVVRERARTVPYDGVDRALRGLLFLGLVTKPTRGHWLPAAPPGQEQKP